jgi:hypothetical protein
MSAGFSTLRAGMKNSAPGAAGFCLPLSAGIRVLPAARCFQFDEIIHPKKLQQRK